MRRRRRRRRRREDVFRACARRKAARGAGRRRQLSEHVVSRRRRQNGDIKSNLLIGSERGPKTRQMGQKGSHHRHCYDRLNSGAWPREGSAGSPRAILTNSHATQDRRQRVTAGYLLGRQMARYSKEMRFLPFMMPMEDPLLSRVPLFIPPLRVTFDP